MPERKSNEQRREEMATRIWLSYYNRILYENGIITERGRNKMALKISNWKMTMR